MLHVNKFPWHALLSIQGALTEAIGVVLIQGEVKPSFKPAKTTNILKLSSAKNICLI